MSAFDNELNDLVVEFEQSAEARFYARDANTLAWNSFDSLRESMVLVRGLEESEAWKQSMAIIKEASERYAMAQDRACANGLAIHEFAQRHPEQLTLINQSLSDAYQRLKKKGIK